VFSFQLAQQASLTEVVQTFEMPTSLLEKAMMGLFGVTEEIKQTNQLGMDRLKGFLETEASRI